jgi:imidazolonepropionase-like amidohydrolase
MHVPGAPDGLKMACGENPKRVYGEDKRLPRTRMGNLALQRATFLKARKLQTDWARWIETESRRIQTEAKERAAYDAEREERARRAAWCKQDPDRSPCAKWQEMWAEGDPDEPKPTSPEALPERDPGLETLIAAMEGRVLVQVHCYRADDMLAMLALADEIGFQVRSFHHALEAYKIRGELAARGISVSTWADWWGFKLEAYDGVPENAALVHEAGGRAVIHSDSAEGIQRLNQEAAKALAVGRRAGAALTDGDAIRWITLNPAWTLGIDQRIGSLEVGKDADVVLWDRSPLSIYAAAEKVWIDGALVHDRARAAARWSDFELGQEAAEPPPPPLLPQAAPAAAAPPARPAQPRLKDGAPGRLTAPSAPNPARAVAAIVGATIHTGAGEIVEDGVVVIEDGLIARVGKGIAPPAGASVVQAGGAVVTPGLTDPLTSVGIVEIDLEADARDDRQGTKDRIRAAFRAADGYNPLSSAVRVTRAEGVTSVGVVPYGGLISGQSAWADLDGATAVEAIAAAPLALHVHLEAGADPEGGGRAAALLHVREAFDDARTFVRTRAAWERNQSRPFAPSRLDLEALAGALARRLPVVFHVDRAADILAALAVAREFDLRPLIAGGAEAWRVAGALAASRVPVVLYPLLPGPESFDALGARADNAARLHAAGVPIAFSAGGDSHHVRKLRQAAGNAVRAGLPHAAAIAALTSGPAEALGLSTRYGAIAPGKVANLVIWSGDPLEVSTAALRVFVRGREVSLTSRQSALLARYRHAGGAPRTPAGSAP